MLVLRLRSAFLSLRLVQLGVAFEPCCAQRRDAIDGGLLSSTIIVRGLGPFGRNFGEERFCCHAVP